MLMLCAALSRLLFDARDRAGALVVLPALSVALVVTLTRSAWIGAAAAAGLLLVLRDRRLLALAPVAAVVFVAIAPAQVTAASTAPSTSGTRPIGTGWPC